MLAMASDSAETVSLERYLSSAVAAPAAAAPLTSASSASAGPVFAACALAAASLVRGPYCSSHDDIPVSSRSAIVA